MPKINDKARAKAQALEYLRELIKPGDRIYIKHIHTARSGMMRVVGAYLIKDNRPLYITYNVAKVLGAWNDRHEGIQVGGCGFDVGFEVTYQLGYALYPDGFDCLENRTCPSSEHSNGNGRDYTPHHHSDGGYALKAEWF